MKYSNFTKANLNTLRKELNEVLSKYGVDANLEFDVGNMRFSEHDVEIKVKAKVTGAKTMEDKLLEQQVVGLGLKMVGVNGQKLVGYNSNNWKYPFIYEHHGKRYKCGRDMARLMFK